MTQRHSATAAVNVHVNKLSTTINDRSKYVVDHFSLAKQGSVRLVLKFAQALADPVTVIAYAEFQNVIEIDRNRNVIYDFAV